MRRNILFCTTMVAAAVWSASALAQEQSPALDEALSRIRSGMASSGVRGFGFSADSGRTTGLRTFRPLSLDGCTVQIEMTIEDSGTPRYPGTIFNAVWTIPLGKLDFTKIRTSYQPGWSKSPTSTRDWEMGYFDVTLPIIAQQKMINSVANIQSYQNAGSRVKDPPPRSDNLDSVDIAFKDKKDAQNLANAFVQASRLCREGVAVPKALLR